MEVIENTHTKLTLKDKPWNVWFKLPTFGLVILGLVLVLASFTVEITYPYYYLLLLGLSIAGGSLYLSSEIYRDILWSFDKKSGLAIQYETRPGFLSLLNVPVLFPKLPPIRREISLDDIADVRVEDKKIGTQYYYRVMMVLTTGEVQPLTSMFKSGLRHPQIDRQTADCIKSFLHIVRPQYSSGLEHYV